MDTNISEFPKHPLPHSPQPQEPQRPQVQPPTILIYEKQRWEYRVVRKDAAEAQAHCEDELNALGKDGWELVGVLALTTKVQFYFKRIRS